MVLSTEWSQVEVIDLVNDGNGLGFMLVGGRSTGVVIKCLIPGGVAERDGRLQNGDHVLQIGDVNLRGFSSEQVASVLRQAGSHVRLIVARPIEPSNVDYHTLASHAPVVPTKLLSDPDELTRHLFQNAAFAAQSFLTATVEEATAAVVLQDRLTPHAAASILPPLDLIAACPALPSDIPVLSPIIPIISPTSTQSPSPVDNYANTPETETYDVELKKNVYGLGITVAGYVCEEEDLSGIFVKSIIEGSAAEMSGKIQINDRIVAVDGKCLGGVSNHQAVEILRNTDICVNLTLERFLRGRKYEHLQVALTDANKEVCSQNSVPQSPSIATLSWVAVKSDADSAVTEEIGETQLDYELASHTTLDSNISMMLENYCENNVDDVKSEESDQSNSEKESSNSRSHQNSNKGDDRSGKFNVQDEVVEATIVNHKTQIFQNNLKNGQIAIKKSENNMCSETNSPQKTETKHIVLSATASLNSLQRTWKDECPDSDIIVAEINKLSSLGISLEGTVDVECGIEKRPHHYIRSILPESPVGMNGRLKPGDEILQANEHKLQGLKHTDVVKILKELPSQVKLVCARGPRAPSVINTSQNPEAFESRSLLPGGHQSLQGFLTKAQSESSLYTSSTATLTDQQRSKSLEQVSGLALWSSEVVYVEIEKTEFGFGFSILDYQDPLDPEGTVIVIRGLIPGGSAETTNQIFPGDRLVCVEDISLQGISLDEAVSILKGMPIGNTKIGLCRPLSTSDNNIASPADSNST
ncbi:patj homolog [Condylostylus longicornis]|uniref:patj homolog n=1 Tax=Condylostylus longicornis TaxID=2530218 RepID=UPI00244E1415|nr:patj homolog [Condylostylus longicornis]